MAEAPPILFDEFFDSNLEETVSPFLTPSSRRWGRDLPLRASILSLVLLVSAFGLSFSAPLAPLSAILLLFVYLLAGIPKLINSINDLMALDINIDILMTLAAFLAILIGSAMEGALLLVLFAISGSIESAVTSKARSAIRSLHKLAPTRAVVVMPDGRLLERSIKDIAVGTRILVKAGEIVPLDGDVIEGSSSLNLSHLTGEHLPVHCEVGDEAPAGGLNLDGVLTLTVSRTSGDSTLARIIKLITQAHESRPKFQRWLDTMSRGYAITIISLTLLFALTFPWILSIPYLGFEGSIYRALAFMIAASPCALIIALPIAYLSAVSCCARKGVLLKGGVTLDALASCQAVAFDKTGTLTLGRLTCLGVELLTPSSAVSSRQVVAVAAGLERGAVHPIAEAIASYAEAIGESATSLRNFRSLPGYGLEGEVHLNGESYYAYIGHPAPLASHLSKEELALLEERVEESRKEGKLVSTLLVGDQVALFRFQDTPRPGVRSALDALRERGLRLLMLTGDHHANAEAIAAEVGIDEYYADLRPEDKLKQVGRLSQQQGLAMVGDGINDGPALARATTGISMGEVGSRTAIDASDIVLLQDRLDLLSWLWDKAHQTQSIVRQNVALATLVIIGASLAALLGFVPLWLAVVLHEGGTVVVGMNSLRLLR